MGDRLLQRVGVLGYGLLGELELAYKNGPPIETYLGMLMAAAGLNGVVLDGGAERRPGADGEGGRPDGADEIGRDDRAGGDGGGREPLAARGYARFS